MGNAATKFAILFVPVILIGMLSMVKNSPAATYYVRTDGNNNCTGQVDQGGSSGSCAWRTLQHAADVVQAGDTVLVGNGTYQGFMIQAHGTLGLPIVFKAQSTGANITTPNTNTDDGINIESWEGSPTDFVTVDGFNVYNQPRMGIRAIGGNGIVIKNCTSHNNSSNGIFSGDTPNIQVLNNTTYENGSSQYEHNIYISNALSDGAIVRGNLIYNSNTGNGLQLNGDWEMGGDGFIDNALIENNIVYGNSKKGLSLISIRYGRIQNNFIYNNGPAAGGIHLVDQLERNFSTGNVVVNNTIDEPGQASIRINDGSDYNYIFNNISVGATGIKFEGVGNFQSNNYSSDDGSGLFVNRAGHDYHLLQNSPAKSFGTASYQANPAPALDLEGNVRPQGTGFDAGAYEFAEAPLKPAAPTGLSVQ
jgi:hypothetical protein